MNERIAYLTALMVIAQNVLNTKRFYTNLFRKYGTVVTSPTPEIKLDNLMDDLAMAGVVLRGTELPIMDQSGVKRFSIEPDDIGGQFPYTADDIAFEVVGMPSITADGKQITAAETIEKDKARKCAAIVANRIETICAESILSGIYTAKNGVLNLDNKTLAAGTALAIPKGEIFENLLVKVDEFSTKKGGIYPIILIGADLFGKLRTELKAEGYSTGEVLQMDGDTPTIVVGNVKVFSAPTAVGANGQAISMNGKIVMLDPRTLALAFAAIGLGDIVTNTSMLLKQESVMGETRVTVFGGAKGFFSKSCPLAIVADKTRYQKFNVTIS